ncbi:MAG TPA: GAF domain-containing SpoIIE family protein phosphatase, partial [Thermomicrobiales bacterium]|nr:GAF domain-containing SpoIIE family protein phosphatase [Thermomicrobiales bacterium]
MLDLIPGDELERLAAVHRYDVLDTPPDGAFDRITALAARLLKVPVAIVSIVDADRIWFKSHHGLDVDQIDREPGLCASAILHDGPWLVNDARVDARTLANPLVAGEMGVGFYAGVPLTTHDGYSLGTLCVLDLQPRQLSDEEVATLSDLAALVMDELELRLSARRSVSLEAQLRQSAEDIASVLQESLLPPHLPTIAGLDLAARYHVAYNGQVGGDFYDVVPTEHGCAIVVGDAVGKGVRAAALTGTARWTLRTVAMTAWTPAEALRRLNAVLVLAHEDPERYVTLAVGEIRPTDGGGTLTMALGGHPHPLLLRTDGTIEPIGQAGPLVGWRAEAEFADVQVRLCPGDVIVMFTDGLLEAIAGRGEIDDTAVQCLLRPLAGATADEVADALDA